MGTVRRWCRVCEEETLHDKSTSLMREDIRDGALVRTFYGIFTLGLTEAMAQHFLTCQKCGNEIEK